jgi:hypothetical protein
MLPDSIIMDPPFGLNLAIAGWDSPELAMNFVNMKKLLQQIAAINTCNKVFLATYFKTREDKEIANALEDAGFTAVTNLYLYKSGHQATGTNNYLFAVDGMLIAFLPVRKDGIWSLCPNPMLRHNLFIQQRVLQKQKRADGNVVNEHEKHPSVAKGLLECHSTPGSTVLIPFAGAGGEVVGAIYAQRDVVAFESDPDQFICLKSRLTLLAATEELPPLVDYCQPRFLVTPDNFGPGIEHDIDTVFEPPQLQIEEQSQEVAEPATLLLEAPEVPEAEAATATSPVDEEAKATEE